MINATPLRPGPVLATADGPVSAAGFCRGSDRRGPESPGALAAGATIGFGGPAALPWT